MVELSFESVDTMTQTEFSVWCRERASWDRHHYELLNGRVVMNPPAGFPHGSVESRVVRLLANHVLDASLGECFGSSQGFELPTGDTVEPDASYVSKQRWQTMPDPEPGRFLRVVPDLTVEILSAATAHRDRGEKKALYGRAGVREYWIIDPRARTLICLTRQEGELHEDAVHEETDTFESPLLPGLTFPVASLFPAAP